MVGHKICFYREMWLIIPKLSLLFLLTWSSDMSMPVEHLCRFFHGKDRSEG